MNEPKHGRIRQVDDQIWLVSLMHHDIGFFDDEPRRFEPAANPFGAKVLPMSPKQSVTYVSGTDHCWMPRVDSNHD